MIDRTLERYGRIDTVVPCAGTILRSSAQDMPLDDFRTVLDINLKGTFLTVTAAARAMVELGQGGNIVLIGSIHSVRAMRGQAAYAASKGALTTMTLSLARALAPKIRVNAVCPGFIDTPWFGGLGEESRERLRQGVIASTPLKAASTAEEIADATLFLGSPQSRHVTGETLLVDAGTHLGFASLGMR